MAVLIAIAVGVLVTAGVFLALRPHTFPVIIGLVLISYGVNIVLFASGGFTVGGAPIYVSGQTEYPDPVPQALVLTAIVIGFAMTAFILVLALRARYDLGSDHVDGTPNDAHQPGGPS